MQDKGKVYCSSDWHGCGQIGRMVLKYLKPNDILYFLGDAVDRGPDGIELFQALINDPRVIFLKGNHEEMMSKAIPYIWADIAEGLYYPNGYNAWYENGGRITANSFYSMKKEEVFNIKKKIDQMPLETTYISPNGHTVILEHAGYTPDITCPIGKHKNPLWDREHFNDNWSSLEKNKNLYLVHGHTPVQYLRFTYGYNGSIPLTKEEIKIKYSWWEDDCHYDPKIIKYCDGHKFNIDLCTIVSNKIALLDLDTFKTIYFYKEPK